MKTRRRLFVVFGMVGVAALLATGAVIRAQGQAKVSACATCAPPKSAGSVLPPVNRGPQTRVFGDGPLSVLLFDDGTCESGLGAGVPVTDLVAFDTPTACAPNFEVVALTTRMNTGAATAFAFSPGAVPPIAGAANFTPITDVNPFGPCPATTLTSRVIPIGGGVISGANFFAGLRTPDGFAGRDTNGPPAGRIWLNCATCGMTQYSPTTLSSLGLGGNWMIRVTVEETNLCPVELMGFDVE